MYRTLLGDLKKLRPLLLVKRPFELNVEFYPVDLPFLRFAAGAIVGVNPRVSKPSGDASKRQIFSLGIHSKGH